MTTDDGNTMSNNTSKPLTLFELNHLVSEVIAIDLQQQYWVEAEVSEIREVRGHCYLELVQKEAFTNTPVARASAKCWANKWSTIRARFERVAQQPVVKGMKLLLLVYANFHEAFGFSWIITDINAEYTLGNLARRRQEILQTLREEGVIDLQKSLHFSPFALRIAVISSSGAAGYDDFCHQLLDNNYGFKFSTELFAAVMQGEKTEQSIIQALNRINKQDTDFDAVVIIRGGGATSDLSGFDTLALAENVANFPLPIITGIGHNRDESIIDIVSYLSVKTPTAAAAFLIDNIVNTQNRIDAACRTIRIKAMQIIEYQKLRLTHLTTSLTTTPALAITRQKANVNALSKKMSYCSQTILMQSYDHLRLLNEKINIHVPHLLKKQELILNGLDGRMKALDPQLMLKRGYSITTTPDGKVVRDASTLKAGDKIITKLNKGKITSIIK